MLDVGVVAEPLLYGLLSLLRRRRLEHRCMPVIDRVKEREETLQCQSGRQIWNPAQYPGGPSPRERPVNRIDLHRFFYPSKYGEAKPTKPIIRLAMREGFVEGCIVDDPERRDHYRAYLCLTFKGRRAWDRYCTPRRMRWRSRKYSLQSHNVADLLPRDPRTEWSMRPPEANERLHAREMADVTFG